MKVKFCLLIFNNNTPLWASLPGNPSRRVLVHVDRWPRQPACILPQLNSLLHVFLKNLDCHFPHSPNRGRSRGRLHFALHPPRPPSPCRPPRPRHPPCLLLALLHRAHRGHTLSHTIPRRACTNPSPCCAGVSPPTPPSTSPVVAWLAPRHHHPGATWRSPPIQQFPTR